MPEPKQQIEYIPQNLGDPCRINDYLSILIAANTDEHYGTHRIKHGGARYPSPLF